MKTFDNQPPDNTAGAHDQHEETGTVEIQRLLAWYFREDPPRQPGARDLRDAA
jgi:hypothetical protein